MTAPTLAAGQLDVAGVSTAVIDTGTPGGAVAPPVLLLHGSGPGVTATANWRPIFPAVSASRRVIAPDQLGFGGTATGEQRTYGRTAWTDHALALLDTLELGTVDIIGNSMGGAIALSIAAARPDAVRRTYRLLAHRLANLDVDPDPETEQLVAELLRRPGA